MAKRILNMTAEEMTHATKSELIEAIAGSEGRVLASETIGITIPLLTDVTNAEFAASMGADLILLNMFHGTAGSGKRRDGTRSKTSDRTYGRHQSGTGGRKLCFR